MLRSTPDVSPPSGLAAMDQYLPLSASLPVGETADSPLLPALLTPRRMVEGLFVPGSVVTSPTGETDVAGGHPRMPDLSREGPFDVHQNVHLGHEKTLAAALQLPTRRGPHLVERAGAATVCDFTQQDVVRSHASRFRSGAISGGCDAAGGAVVPCSSGSALHGGHGIVAAT